MRFLAVFGLCAAVFAGGDIALLVGAAKDPERGVRYAAVQALGKAGAGIETLIAALDDSEWCVRQAAGHALARVGKSAVPALTKAAQSTKTHVRVEAIEALRRIGTDDAMKIVITALDDEDPLVIREALDGIWMRGEKNMAAVPGIERHLDHDDANMRVTAHWALLTANPKSADRIRKRIRLLPYGEKPNDWSSRWTTALVTKLWPKPIEPPTAFDIKRFPLLAAPARRLALAKLRKRGKRESSHADALRELLDADDKEVIRDAAIALELIGEDPRAALDDYGEWNALLYCKPGGVNADDGYRHCGNDEARRDWALVIGRCGKANDDAIKALRRFAEQRNTQENTEVRAAAVWALGRVGVEMLPAVRDSSLAVRTIAVRFVENIHRLKEIARGRSREPAVLAVRRLGELGKPDASPEIVGHADPLIRIAAARALGKDVPDSMADDPERDVRIAVAMQRAIPRQLRDSSWRVRLASIRSHGRARLGAEQLAPFLSDPNLALSNAAAEALPLLRTAAADPVARLLTPGNPGVWHYAARIFDLLGPDGAAAVPALVATLQHEDPTARETAARCLAAIGPGAHAAAPALVHALADSRVGVVSHAALALGRIGSLGPIRAAMTSKHARVRAYATFAMGWAHGARREIDQAPYEPRLPLLDCGQPDLGVTLADIAGLEKKPDLERLRISRRGIRSKDPRIAYLCAWQLEFDGKSPWECERATELIIAEGFRPGYQFGFSNFRYALGSNELPASLEFLMYARETGMDRNAIFGQLHRAPRSSNIPALCWFARNEDAIRLEGFDNLDQPFWRTTEYRAELERHWGGTIWELIEKDQYIETPVRWWLESEPIPTERVPLLIRIADRYTNVDDVEVAVVMKALGRAKDAMSEQYLRRAATCVTSDDVPLVSLARRGDPVALVRAVEAARAPYALGLLMEFLPDVAGAVLRDQMASASFAPIAAEHIDESRRHGSYMRGVEWTFEPFLGLESSVAAALLNTEHVAKIMQVVPGCRTRRLGNLIMRRLEKGPHAGPLKFDPDLDDNSDDLAALLWTVAPERMRAFFRQWAASEDVNTRNMAVRYLARVAEPEDATLLAGSLVWIAREQSVADTPPWLRDLTVEAFTKSAAADGDGDSYDTSDWQVGFALDYADDEDLDARIEKAGRSINALAVYRSILEARIDVGFESERYPRRFDHPWIRHELERRYEAREHGGTDELLATLALWPGKKAKAEYWSAVRAGRYMWIIAAERESESLTLGRNLTTLPHWRRELESNCCRISGRLQVCFEDLLDINVLYNCATSGYGEPASDRVLDWFELMGGDVVWSPIARRFLPRPE